MSCILGFITVHQCVFLDRIGKVYCLEKNVALLYYFDMADKFYYIKKYASMLEI